jgi:hypothetical protein
MDSGHFVTLLVDLLIHEDDLGGTDTDTKFATLATLAVKLYLGHEKTSFTM